MYLQFNKTTKEVLNISDKKMPVVAGLQMIEFHTDFTLRSETFDEDGIILTETHQMPTDIGDLKIMMLEDKDIKHTREISVIPYLGNTYNFDLQSQIYIIGLYVQAKHAVIEGDATWSIMQLTADGQVSTFSAIEFVTYGDTISEYIKTNNNTHVQNKSNIIQQTTIDSVYNVAVGV